MTILIQKPLWNVANTLKLIREIIRCMYFHKKINNFIILIFNCTRPNFEDSSHCAVSRAHATETVYVRENRAT